MNMRNCEKTFGKEKTASVAGMLERASSWLPDAFTGKTFASLRVVDNNNEEYFGITIFAQNKFEREGWYKILMFKKSTNDLAGVIYTPETGDMFVDIRFAMIDLIDRCDGHEAVLFSESLKEIGVN